MISTVFMCASSILNVILVGKMVYFVDVLHFLGLLIEGKELLSAQGNNSWTKNSKISLGLKFDLKPHHQSPYLHMITYMIWK